MANGLITGGRSSDDRSVNRSCTALQLAVTVVIEQCQKLTAAERADLCELLRIACSSHDQEEVAAAYEAVQEIIDNCDSAGTVSAMPKSSVEANKSWRTYVSSKIREHRNLMGLNQSELASLAGIEQATLSRIETAKSSPSCTTIEKIAKALGVDPSVLDPSL